MSKIDDATQLHHMLDAARESVAFVQGKSREDLDSDRLLSLALVRLIEIVCKAATNVSNPSCYLLKIGSKQVKNSLAKSKMTLFLYKNLAFFILTLVLNE